MEDMYKGCVQKRRTWIPKKNLEIPEAYIDIICIMYYNWTVLKSNAEHSKRDKNYARLL